MNTISEYNQHQESFRHHSNITLSLIFLGIFACVQSQHTIHGTVYDQGNGEHLVSATVFDTISKAGTVTNEYGFFSLKTSDSVIELTCSYVGYSTFQERYQLHTDSAINIAMETNLHIDEVTVSAQSANRDFLASQMSAHNIGRLETQKMPLLFGETDLIKALQYLPGVSSGMEGTSGIFVRGGGTDQNLVLLDGVPVYNVNHLFGLFSVFNGDAINNATLYKGGFPARYSGRLSSVLDIRLKEGNMKEFHGSASIGLISSKLLLEGPIIKDKTSFLISARRTYADVASYPIQYFFNKQNNSDSYFGYFFHDLNAKINHRFSEKSRLYFSTYAGKDEFYTKDYYPTTHPITNESVKLQDREGFNWGNWTSALRWNYIWSNRLFSNVTLSYSTYKFRDFEERDYLYRLSNDEESESYHTVVEGTSSELYYSGIKDLSGRMDFSFIPSSNHNIRFGAKGTRYMFEPGVTVSEFTMDDRPHGREAFGADTVNANQVTAYLEDDFQLGKRIRANIGVSSTLFNVNEKNYYSIEPRISARYLITNDLVAKASVAKMSQHLHLLTNSTIGLPTDVWVPTTATIVPEESWQTAIGLKYKTRSGLDFSVESFYKEMKNLVEYQEGQEIFLNDHLWESRIVTGNGTAYGLELFVEKSQGRLTGSLAYTLSKNTREFEEIDNGQPFPFKYDRRHDFSAVLNFKIKEHISLGAVWVFGSGIHVTTLDHSYFNPLILSQPNHDIDNHYYSDDIIRNYNERNGYQLPAYHRLDVGLNFDKKKKRFDRTLSVGAYNAYSRKNAFYIYSDQGKFTDTNQWEKRIYQVTLLPFIPYIKYSIRF